MLIKVINPNTTLSMTEKIGDCARSVAAAGTVIEAVSPTMGPASIESHYDEALAVPGLLAEIASGERDGADGYVIACFGDPGLDAARELARGPVIGIAEVTTLGRTRGRAWELAARYGMSTFCRNVRACEIPVLELDLPGSPARERITQECKRAVEDDGADVVVLGCAGMADLCAYLSEQVGVPVVDGVAAATKTVESLVALGLQTSTRSEYAAPGSKQYAGLLEQFTV